MKIFSSKLCIQVKAFSLVEILVVLGLFSSISTLSLGALFNAQAINAKVQETQGILDNITLSYQTISRDIRFGSEFFCDTTVTPGTVPLLRKDCQYSSMTGGGTILVFKPADAAHENDRVMYYIKNGILYKDEYPFVGATSTLQMTANEVTITALTFFVEGAQTSSGLSDVGGASDYKQPLVTMLISGVTKPARSTVTPVTFNLQTTISVRQIDNK